MIRERTRHPFGIKITPGRRLLAPKTAGTRIIIDRTPPDPFASSVNLLVPRRLERPTQVCDGSPPSEPPAIGPVYELRQMNPSICLIVGDDHTQHCGVKDYANRLGKSLEKIGLSAEVLAPPDWSVASFLQFCKRLRQRNFDILHVQYPSIGHRTSLWPHLVGLMRIATGVVVTLHEYSSMPILQRASTHLFRRTADQMVFTAETELTNYGRSGVVQRVIHIGSSVPAFLSDLPRTPTVLYFGQIRPAKGLEEFLELARRSLKLTRPFKFQVIGSVPHRRAAYYQTVRENSVPEVEWLVDLPFDQVARLMSVSLATYLPYPDGASYRRSSLLAALTNGLPAISTVSPATPREMIDVLLPASGPGEALAHLERLYRSSDELQAYSHAARLFAEKFSWTEIALQHEKVYQETLSRPRMSSVARLLRGSWLGEGVGGGNQHP
jgi:glycosyltransferase involved in cell wall biosynthesis